MSERTVLIEVDVPEGYSVSEVILSGMLMRNPQTTFLIVQPAPVQGDVAAWLDLTKLESGGMAYATKFKVNDKQTPLSAQREQPMSMDEAAAVMRDRKDGVPPMAYQLSLEGAGGVTRRRTAKEREQPQGVVVPRKLLDRLTAPLSVAEYRVWEMTDRLDAFVELRALLSAEGR